MFAEILRKQLLNKKVISCFIVCLAIFGIVVYQGRAPISDEEPNFHDAWTELTAGEKINLLKGLPLNMYVNDEYEEMLNKEYRLYVDKYGNSNEEIQRALEQEGKAVTLEEVATIKYDIEYEGIVFDHEKEDSEIHYYLQTFHREYRLSIADIDDRNEFSTRVLKKIGFSEQWVSAALELRNEQFANKLIYDGYSLGYSIYNGSHVWLIVTLGIFLVFSLHDIFSDDRKTRVIYLIGASKKRKQVFFHKVLAILLISVVSFAMFELTNFAICSLHFGMGDPRTTVVSATSHTLLFLSVHKLAILTTVTSLFGAIVVGVITSVMSSVLDSRSTLVLGILCLLATFFTSLPIANDGFWDWTTFNYMFNPLSLIGNTKAYSSYAYLLLFGEFIPVIYISIAIGLISIVVSFAGNRHLFKRNFS